MTDDLIERLRAVTQMSFAIGGRDSSAVVLAHEAADEMERLCSRLAEVEKRAALYEVARRMNVPQWQEAMLLNRTGKPFDEIIADLAPFFGLKHPAAIDKHLAGGG